MKQHIRIKPYLQVLKKDGQIDFIKTLDEGIAIPENILFDYLFEVLQNTSDQSEITSQLKIKFEISDADADQLLKQFIALGILEYFTKPIPEDLQRYGRQLIWFDGINSKNEFEENYQHQHKLSNSHVVILGIGGIGNYMALSLAAAGIGKITIVDFDVVEETNLNRQILFTESDLGKSKVVQATKKLQELNSNCKINAIEKNINSAEAFEQFIKEIPSISYIVLAADQPTELVLWASTLCKQYNYKYIKCGYMAYQGLIGPILGPDTKSYEELFDHWGKSINNQDGYIANHNQNHIAPSMAASNAILSNIAALEMIKDITGVMPSCLIEKRLLFNLKTMNLQFG